MAGEIPETFAEFASSFSGGSRNDLSFKFLRAMDPPAAAELLRVLLDEPGSLFDSGDPSALIDAAIAGQQGAYGARALDDHYRYEEVPFTRPSTPVAESRVALVTSSGHFAARHDPRPFGVEGMTQQEAVARVAEFLRIAPTLSAVPIDITAEDLAVRHGGYDIRGAVAGHNVAFPIDRLRTLQASGEIGELLPDAYSFVGATSQMRLLKESAPGWAADLVGQATDVALLVPV